MISTQMAYHEMDHICIKVWFSLCSLYELTDDASEAFDNGEGPSIRKDLQSAIDKSHILMRWIEDLARSEFERELQKRFAEKVFQNTSAFYRTAYRGQALLIWETEWEKAKTDSHYFMKYDRIWRDVENALDHMDHE